MSGKLIRLALRQTEVHLLLETIHLGHLHLQSIAQLDHSSGASSDDLLTRRVEGIEVVHHRGERHQPAHGQAGHIDEKSKVPEIRDERGIALRTR